ncbi:MAG: penicillin acylase family protein [Vicinamibacterales bacterium]
MRRHVLRFFALVLVAVVILTLAGGGYARVVLGRSLPVTDGTRTLAGLQQPVTVERDGLGVPTIRARSRVDLARAIGFVHAQERFFQMDLQRRQPAGELAALVGAAALNADRAMRIHRFRHIARQALTFSPPEYKAELDAYAAGVNAGLAALAAPPFEYLVLRATPEPWTAEDSILTAIAMSVTLQGAQWEYEDTLGAMHDFLYPPLFEFLAGRASDWESPIVGEPHPVPPIPGPEEIDTRNGNVRGRRHEISYPHRISSRRPAPRPGDALPWWARLPNDEAATLGSNNWAVSGTRSTTGSAIVANDMHLRLSVPNIWFRAAYEIPDDRQPGGTRRLVGVTLPGGPQMAVGSNGDIAWGFTNSVGDWSDVVIVEPAPADPTQYQTPDGPRAVDVHRETIAVKDAAPVTIDARWTIWGPIVGVDHDRREQALKWVAHDPRVLATDAARIAHARSVDEAVTLAVGAALAAQNLVVGDRDGHIGWTIYGAIPRRVGTFEGGAPGAWGDVPTSWASGERHWDGYLGIDEHPRVVDPPDGRLWTANARVVGGEMLRRIGDGGYSDGIRAWMIRDRLRALDTADERALFAIQLDNRSLFLDRWRTVFLGALTLDAAAASPLRGEARRLVESAWSGRADADSVAYRIVRAFRLTTSRMALNAITGAIHGVGADAFDLGTIRRIEGPLWRLVDERPPHLLDPAYESWDAFLLAAIDRTLADLTAGGAVLGDRTWGEANAAAIAHPLAAAVPWVRRFLAMPPDPLPGDTYVPRVLTPRSGASQRLVASPGHEARAILHMPGGQSGHPLSAHFGDQQKAWVDGTPLPLLPGNTAHLLTLTP